MSNHNKINLNHISIENCVVFVANRGFSLINSRLLLMQWFLSSGWKVVAVTSKDDFVEKLSSLGVIWEEAWFDRGGLSLLQDIQATLTLAQIYRKYQPCLIHHFNAKPILLGNLATFCINRVKVVNTLTGLGHAFIHGGLTRFLAATGYQLLLSKGDATIFQNNDDRELFLKEGWIPEDKAKLIVSSGVDTKRFAPNYTQHNNEAPQVLMVARLLWQKGVREFVEAARIVKQRYPHVCFNLAGEWDLVHPDSVDQAWIQETVKQEMINFLGYLKNIEEHLCSTSIFVLPSFYREGVPRVLLEAAACGVPVVTVDVPGCREAVVEGITGKLVPPRNSQALADAIAELLISPSLRIQMGKAGRQRIENNFDIRMITEKQINIYREIGVNISPLSITS
ncbi:MAG: glycosyltransferase family 4 protein [Symploca sp. SIO2D2]|nr:glycosyltransferase family 4 protein [Symploca sp. SIO2D2]